MPINVVWFVDCSKCHLVANLDKGKKIYVSIGHFYGHGKLLKGASIKTVVEKPNQSPHASTAYPYCITLI